MGSLITGDVSAVDMDGNFSDVPIAELVWRPSAYGVVIKDGKVLVVRQKNGYDLPGGGVELGEAPEEAVLREIKEESGIDAANPRLLGVENSFFRRDDGLAIQALMMYYKCDFVGGELSTDGFDEWEQQYAEEPEWLPLEQIEGIKLGTSINYRTYIKQALEL